MRCSINKSLHMIILKFLVRYALHKSKKNKDKFAPRGRKCLFVGYPFGQKWWKMYDLETQEFFIYQDVIFKKIFFHLRRLL